MLSDFLPCHRAQQCRQARDRSQIVCAAAAAAASPLHGVAWSQLGSMLLGAGVFLLGLAAVILLIAAVPLLLVRAGHLASLHLNGAEHQVRPINPEPKLPLHMPCLSLCPKPALLVAASQLQESGPIWCLCHLPPADI